MQLAASRPYAATPSRFQTLPAPFRWTLILVPWILGWTILFSALDFWTIKLFDICNEPWFQTYRSLLRNGASWVSPPSFALAENTYFVWVNAFDRGRTMHEWEFYTGNPVNPDGDYDFVWGDDRGGWVEFPMERWYAGWLVPTMPWLLLSILFIERKKLRPRVKALLAS